MNYYCAREKLDGAGNPTGMYHFTCANDGRIWRVGPCAENCPGHATPEDAAAHYRQGLLATAHFQGPKQQRWPKHKCAVPGCDQEATWLGETGPGNTYCYEFCGDHANCQGMSQVLQSVDTIMSSY